MTTSKILYSSVSIIKNLLILMFMLIMPMHYATASITNAYTITMSGISDICNDGHGTDVSIDVRPGSCVISEGYPPHTGYFKERVEFMSGFYPHFVESSPFYLDATKSIAEQPIVMSGNSAKFSSGQGNYAYTCHYLVDEDGKKYYLYHMYSSCTGNAWPVPPTPPVPDTSCTINNGNALSVSLGTLDRAEIPTIPASGTAKNIPVSVNCTGADVTVNMQLNYTPLSIGGNDVVQTSTNGVGVAIMYDNKALSTTDITPVTFLEGSNTLNLAFQAVRDSGVELKDIPTGAFTANAVLVMTQQ
ncbi:fimbrial protein [Cronobacter turicensis]|nr:fimbrial protein [Cronobacter turicensis]ELY3626249.1 fimbrial protein [Cronobacter turicensis]